MRSLATFVHVQDDAGLVHVFGPGDQVPEWARKAITNPKVWAEQSAPSPEQASAGGDAGSPVEPPRSGKGSGPKVWSEFAHAHNVDVEDGATRDDIIATLIDAGVIEAE